MKRRCILALCMLSVASLISVRVDAQPQAIRVVVNGNALSPNAVDVIGEKVYVALRPVAQALNADIATNGAAKTVTITTLLRQVVLHLDDPWAFVNGQRIQLSAPARRNGARVVLPLRAIGEAFGASVVYDPRTHTAIVAAALRSTPGGRPTPPPASAAKTLSGAVLSVAPADTPPTLQIRSGGTDYTVTVPNGTSIAFRDVHGAVTGNGVLSQVRPGDTLVVALDANGQLNSMVDLFASINGTIAAVADQNMVLENGRVISADPTLVSVTLDGREGTFASLKAGDKVSVRADPISGQVRDVVALRPGGFATSATSTPAPGSTSAGGAVSIARIKDNATNAFRAGQVFTVAADGTPGARATFDLSDVIIDNPMRETRSGHYEGQFEVGVGTNLTAAPVLVRLSRGGETALAQAPDPLTIVTTPPSVKDAAPGDDARINTSRPNIFASFQTVGNTGMDPDSLRMTVNGRDVTALATRTDSFISYYPAADLGAQAIRVEVKGTDIAGNTLDYAWSFAIGGK